MAEYNKRLQILLTEEQHDFLHSMAASTGQSVGELVRAACEQVYRPHSSVRELQALQFLKDHPVYLQS